jgi:predicted nucleic acid-binding protein
MSARYLVDANVLIALSVTDHEYHDRAATWSVAVDTFAVCPIVEGSLVRFLTRMGAGAPVAISLLERLRSGGRCEFWPDSLRSLTPIWSPSPGPGTRNWLPSMLP